MKNYTKQFVHGAALVLLLATTACATADIKEIEEARWYCEAFLPITWSSADTQETAVQIAKHNAVWESLCKN